MADGEGQQAAREGQILLLWSTGSGGVKLDLLSGPGCWSRGWELFWAVVAAFC